MPGVKPPTNARPVAERIELAGGVQGIGLRPAIARWASQCGVAGAVRNVSSGVQIIVEGSSAQVQGFVAGLETHLPLAAIVGCLERSPLPAQGRQGFVIEVGDDAGPLTAQLPIDVATCAQCTREVMDPANRRRDYPFTSCADCGPRYSILEAMPYERSATAMARFPLCDDCQAEYQTPDDRRFHAQTTACARCGPHVWCTDRAGRLLAERETAVEVVVKALLAGDIVAVRGLGGYQLLCDATCDAAVVRLRQRKARPAKPLAVMVESLAAARQLADGDAASERALCSSANPIVLVPARAENGMSPALHPGLPEIGLMLPTTPLHRLLLRGVGRPLVATSGNREGEPLAHEVRDAQHRLSGIADLFLHHDRPILRSIDDSVVRIIAGRAVTLRLARGLAPLTLPFSTPAPLLALGGQQKVAVAVSNAAQAVLGPHIGDLDDMTSLARFQAQQAQLCQLLRVRPDALVHDLHPDYETSRWATRQALPTRAVQHHHAHIVAGMLEHGWLERTVLGVAWDGTGYGIDGVIWGSEFLLATVAGFQRVAHLRPFCLPGGEAAIREPWRVAVALVRDAVGDEAASRLVFPNVEPAQVLQVLRLLDRTSLAPRTTSAGRLFDAIAALTLGLDRAAYEGHPAMLLEAVCGVSAAKAYPLPLRSERGDGVAELDWRPLIAALLQDRASAAFPSHMAERFHRGLADGIVTVCSRYQELVVLRGGVFQNRILTELVARKLQAVGRTVGLPGMIPPGDGGLAAGQLAIAALGSAWA